MASALDVSRCPAVWMAGMEISEPNVPIETLREIEEAGGTQYKVYERVWYDLKNMTLRQVEFWPEIPAEASSRWPFNIYLRPIIFAGWEQKKRVKRFTIELVEGAEDYGVVEYEGIGRAVRSVLEGGSDEVPEL